jgi:hypothetical protein
LDTGTGRPDPIDRSLSLERQSRTAVQLLVEPARNVEAHELRSGIEPASFRHLDPAFGACKGGVRRASPRTVRVLAEVFSELSRHARPPLGSRYNHPFATAVPGAWHAACFADFSVDARQERYAEALRLAARTLGGEPELARLLGVDAGQLQRWLDAESDVPLSAFLRALGVIADGPFASGTRNVRVAAIRQERTRKQF